MVEKVIKRAKDFSAQWGKYIKRYKDVLHWRAKDKTIILISHSQERPMNGVELRLSEPIDKQIDALAHNITKFPIVDRSKKREEEHKQQAKFIFDLMQNKSSNALQAIESHLNAEDIVFAGSEVVLYEGNGVFHTERKQIMDVVLVSPSKKRIYVVEMKKLKPSKNKNMSPEEQLNGYIQTYGKKERFSALREIISCYSGENVTEKYSIEGIVLQGYSSNETPNVLKNGKYITFCFN